MSYSLHYLQRLGIPSYSLRSNHYSIICNFFQYPTTRDPATIYNFCAYTHLLFETQPLFTISMLVPIYCFRPSHYLQFLVSTQLSETQALFTNTISMSLTNWVLASVYSFCALYPATFWVPNIIYNFGDGTQLRPNHCLLFWNVATISNFWSVKAYYFKLSHYL
jgi:hypothetical protein